MRAWTVAGGLIEHDGRLLLVQNRRRDGSTDWTTPGGVVDPGEEILEALSREVREETGLSVTGWEGPLWQVEAEAPDMGWTLRVEVHRATGFEGAIALDDPDGIVVVHPEVPHETVQLADQVGSTDYIIRALADAPAGSTVAVGTEVHLVNRLAQEHPDKTVVSLDPLICPCSTMNRIDLPHLVWAMESLVNGTVVNQIEVDPETERWAKVALDRMLALPGKTHKD